MNLTLPEAKDNKTSFTDGRGKVKNYAYTVRNEMSGITYPGTTADVWMSGRARAG